MGHVFQTDTVLGDDLGGHFPLSAHCLGGGRTREVTQAPWTGEKGTKRDTEAMKVQLGSPG